MNKMNNFRKITNIKGKTDFILKEMGYNSIKEAKIYVDDITNKNNNEKQVLNFLKNQYNEILDQLDKTKRALILKTHQDKITDKNNKKMKNNFLKEINDMKWVNEHFIKTVAKRVLFLIHYFKLLN